MSEVGDKMLQDAISQQLDVSLNSLKAASADTNKS